MKIHITSCDMGEKTYREKELRLRHLHSVAAVPRHELVEDPAVADLILVGNLWDDDWYRVVRDDRVLNRYPDKCFGIDDIDQPAVLIRGVYSGAERNIFNFGRVRTGSYDLYQRGYLNPFVREFAERREQAEKRYLFSFIGRAETHAMRERLCRLDFSRDDVLVEDSGQVFDNYDYYSNEHVERQKHFARVLLESKFTLCPRGRGVSSVRLFEALELGVCPVIISDGWFPPPGVDWDSVALRVRERDVDRIEEIVATHEGEYQALGRRAREAHEAHFAEDRYFNYVVDACLDIRAKQAVPERWFWRLRHVNMLCHRLRRKVTPGMW